MNFLITGGTGFIGSPLCDDLLKSNHQITVITRRPNSLVSNYQTIQYFDELSVDEHFDVVINLAGEAIADKRWTETQRLKILNSRIDMTQRLVSYLKSVKHKPRLLISGSAIGYYGIDSNSDTTEFTGKGDDSFVSDICSSWEIIASQAETMGIRTCLLRFGIVLGHEGGALKKMLPAFKLGLGGQLGSGKQWMSWIHIKDVLRIIKFCIEQERLIGPINCSAPFPINNQRFTYALSKVLHRPAFFTVPRLILTSILGEMANELLIEGKKVLPTKLLESGFEFEFETIDETLHDILGKD